MAAVDNSSATDPGSKCSQHVNQRAKRAMMNAVDKYRKGVEPSGRYYQKKRDGGKQHNQALRALGSPRARVIFKMRKEDRDYYL